MFGWSRLTHEPMHKHRSVFIKFLVSYMILLFVSALFGWLIYMRMEAVMVENANHSHLALLEQAQQVVDHQLKDVDQLTNQIGSDPKLQVLLNEVDGSNDRYAFIEFMRALSRYQGGSHFVNDFFIYFANTETILSPTMKTNPRLYFEHIRVYQNKNESDILNEMLSGYHWKSYFPSESVGMGPSERNTITYVQSLPLGEPTDIMGSLVVLIDERQIRNLLHPIEGLNNGITYIFNEHQEVMMTNDDNQGLLDEIRSSLTSDRGYVSGEFRGEEMIMTYTTSSQNGWTYVSVVPKEVVLSQVNELKSSLLILVLIGINVGLIISFYMTIKHYKPIKEVIQAITTGKKMPHKEMNNEFDMIKNTIVTSFNEEKQLRKTLSKQAPVIKNNFLSRLIRGYVDLSTLTDEYLEFIDLKFPLDPYHIILIEIDSNSQFMKKNTEQEWSLIRFIIGNISHELLDGQGDVIDMDRGRLAILIHPTPALLKDDPLYVHTFIDQLKEIVEKRFKTGMTIAVSQTYEKMEDMGKCYGEAVMAMDYKMIKGHNSVIFYENIKEMQQDKYSYYYPQETEVQLMNLTKSGDFVNIEKLLNQIYDVNFYTQSITPEMGKCLFIDLISTILKLVNSLHIDDKKVFPGVVDPIQTITDCSTAVEMQAKIKGFYSILCTEVKETHTDHNQDLINRITNYIESHYDDSMLSLNTIADHFDLNPSYLSSFFRKYSGQTITDFIAQYRIHHSKEMLADSSLTVAQIAEKVGYANSVGLIRVFKKIEGITPGKYRQTIEKQG